MNNRQNTNYFNNVSENLLKYKILPFITNHLSGLACVTKGSNALFQPYLFHLKNKIKQILELFLSHKTEDLDKIREILLNSDVETRKLLLSTDMFVQDCKGVTYKGSAIYLIVNCDPDMSSDIQKKINPLIPACPRITQLKKEAQQAKKVLAEAECSWKYDAFVRF